MSIFENWAVQPIINASGSVTRLGGAPLPPAVLDAFVAAATECVPLDELQAAASRELAAATGAEAGLVTCGAVAAVTLGAAAILAGFDGCTLKFSAKNLAFADGNPEGRVMLVGEAPGADEDRIGKPFMGRSGQLLDRMLAAIGLDRQSAYIANVIPWRPPGNRTPTPQETEICRPFIERQIELCNPKILVTLGGPSAKTLLHTTEGVLRLRGNWKTHVTPSGISIPAMPTLHPAFLRARPFPARRSRDDRDRALGGPLPARHAARMGAEPLVDARRLHRTRRVARRRGAPRSVRGSRRARGRL